jgi:hypothetical protein
MPFAVSADGTLIAFDQSGAGPPLIIAAGAFNTRSTTAPLARALRDRFTVLNYDRRGPRQRRHASLRAEREIEDLAAVIEAAGGSAAVFGYSSGANLALEAAAAGAAITRLALYDAPFLVDDSHPKPPSDLAARRWLAGVVARPWSGVPRAIGARAQHEARCGPRLTSGAGARGGAARQPLPCQACWLRPPAALASARSCAPPRRERKHFASSGPSRRGSPRAAWPSR